MAGQLILRAKATQLVKNGLDLYKRTDGRREVRPARLSAASGGLIESNLKRIKRVTWGKRQSSKCSSSNHGDSRAPGHMMQHLLLKRSLCFGRYFSR